MKNFSIRATVLIGLPVLAMMLMAHCALFGRQSSSGSHGIEEFQERVKEYEKLRKRGEKSLPALKKTSKQEVIAAQQQALVDKIRELRSGARQGDIFTPSATAAIAQLLKKVFAGPDAHRVQDTIQAGNPLKDFEVRVNQRYPDSMTFTIMPPTLLEMLPRLPDEVAYRILGSTLLLVDGQANMIIDFMPNAIP